MDGVSIVHTMNIVHTMKFSAFKYVARQHSKSPSLAIVRMFLIKEDLSWQVYVGEHLIPTQNDVLMLKEA